MGTRLLLADESRNQFYDTGIRNSQVMGAETHRDILADTLPIAKARVNVMIHKNKEKIKIA